MAGFSGPQFGEIFKVATNDPASFLPESAESTEVNQRLDEFRDADLIPAIVVIKNAESTGEIDSDGLSDLPDRLSKAA